MAHLVDLSGATPNRSDRRNASATTPHMEQVAEKTAPTLAPEVIAAAHEHATEAALRSDLHGPRHWRDVARMGLALHARGVRCDPDVVLLFALLHDTQRHSDGHDADHGRRAAVLAREMRGRGALTLTAWQAAKLDDALARHADGEVSDDPTIGACWDADRLTLGRVGVTPNPDLLSTVDWRSLRPMLGLAMAVQSAPDVGWDQLARFTWASPDDALHTFFHGTWAGYRASIERHGLRAADSSHKHAASAYVSPSQSVAERYAEQRTRIEQRKKRAAFGEEIKALRKRATESGATTAQLMADVEAAKRRLLLPLERCAVATLKVPASAFRT